MTNLRSENPYSSSGPLRIVSADLNSRRIPRYSPLEIAVNLTASYDNPFDSHEIDVYAECSGPDNKPIRINGYLSRPYTRTLEGRQEKLVPAAEAEWNIRFTPDRVGKWTSRIFARDKSGTVAFPASTFEVIASKKSGFIRRSRRNPRVFAFEDEKPFFAVGENMCWGGWNGQRGTYDYDSWLAALSKAGGNWIRIWMSSWNCALEWSSDPALGYGEFRGTGHYSLAQGWKLDRILDRAEELGIFTMLCFGTYGEFNEGGFFNEGQWKQNPYNAVNGGPCEKPADFWTNAAARELYKRRLRYLVARYGHRTGIHSWEFWNEAQAPAAWVSEMAKYVKSIDPYSHLVTTTYGNKEVWQIPEIDITQTHHYGKGDIPDSAPVIHEDALKHSELLKPHLMAEFGIDWRKGDENYDPDGIGVNLHNGLWSSLASGNAGSAMIWWWDGYVHPKSLYARFNPVRKFVANVPWTSGPWMPLTPSVSPTGLRVIGQTDGKHAVVWAQNPAHNWQNTFEKKPIPLVSPSTLRFRGLADGPYLVERWDTWSGEVTDKFSTHVQDGALRIQLPAVERDVALLVAPRRR